MKKQLGKLTNTPTLRWIFQCFQVVHFLRINQSPKVVNLTEEKSLILQDLRSTAIYGAKNYHFQDIATIHSAVA
ncbi:MAG: hypothetical protein MGU50_15825 [Trichodesmium sp. MAG_R02]|nr:hypothetical protein [Trichodesmium sp. MAG_R02]